MHDLPTPAAQPGPIQLNWQGTTPVVAPDDRKRFEQQSPWSGIPFPLDLAAERFWQQFRDEFLVAIHQWCQAHADRVAACYVTFPRDHVKVFVARRSPTFDFSLSDDLTDLEMHLLREWWIRDLASEIGMPWQTLRDWATKGWAHGRQTNVEKLWVIWADRDEVKRLRKLRSAKSHGICGYSTELTEPKRRP